MERHRKAEWELQRAHHGLPRDDIKACIPAVQAQQVKMLEAKHDKYEQPSTAECCAQPTQLAPLSAGTSRR